MNKIGLPWATGTGLVPFNKSTVAVHGAYPPGFVMDSRLENQADAETTPPVATVNNFSGKSLAPAISMYWLPDCALLGPKA